MSNMVQAAALDYNSGANRDAGSTGDRKCSRHGVSGARSDINRVRGCVFLLLCDGLWTYSKYALLRDISNKGAGTLHRRMCAGVLDWRHHRHLHALRHAYFHRSSRHLWHLCRRLRYLLDIYLLQGS